MNEGDSGETSSCTIRSKYFTHNSGMDESLSEFREKKKICTGPKPEGKKNSKPRKAPKRPRGQKDIRTALKPKNSELESYSKDFDKVCKKSGIDIDSEQLQLAIALSKSLQASESTTEELSNVSHKVSANDRIKKIRTTLQEYGFKVPELRINTCRVRKPRSTYKLVQASETEKKEIIANRYSQVLFQNIAQCSLYNSESDITYIPLYYLATNVTYDKLRLRETFYVDSLLEQSNTTGNLLRDWSNIPGRPESPKLFEPMKMNFSEIECSQEELNIILSGPLKSCKDIVDKKIKQWQDRNNPKLEMQTDEEITRNDQDIEIVVDNVSPKNRDRSKSPDMFDDDSDIFDDSKNLTIRKDPPKRHMIDTNCKVLHEPKCLTSQSNIHFDDNMTIRKSKDMEMTECIDMQSNNDCVLVDETLSQSKITNFAKRRSKNNEAKANNKINSTNTCTLVHEHTLQISQKHNTTKRKSNDYMELTECVAISPELPNAIDLREIPDHQEHNTIKDKTRKANIENVSFESIVNIGNSENFNSDTNKNEECMDLTQSSNTSDELPYVSLTGTKNKSLDDTIIVDIDDYAYINNKRNIQTEEVHIDLTQSVLQETDARKQSHSFFEEYDHEHSSSTENPKEIRPTNMTAEEICDRIDLTQITEQVNNENFQKLTNNLEETTLKPNCSNSSQITIEPVPVELLLKSPNKDVSQANVVHCSNGALDDKLVEDMDLTQNSGTSEDLSQTPLNNYAVTPQNIEWDASKDPELVLRNSQRCSQLGKIGDLSIDYDDLMIPGATFETNSLETPEEYKNDKTNSRNSSFISNCSQKSEVFEISDREFDYSIHQSRIEIANDNFAIGGISVMDQLSNFESFKKSIEPCDSVGTVNKMQNCLINKNQKKNNEISPIKHRRLTEIATPQKTNSNNTITVVTPKNSELLIKTTNVTPAGNYEAMSTPDLHKELDKYGIKPFKRKRAIQLLTHIYNETHPIIDTNEFASPPKRHKPNEEIHKKHLTPRKLLSSPEKPTKTNNHNEENKYIQENSDKKWKGKGKGKKSSENQTKTVLKSLDNKLSQSKKVVTSGIKIKEIACSADDWVFPKKEKAKVHSCRLPLHIAFHNYVSCNIELREAILCYEPVEIDRIHKDLVGYGLRYDPKDLLKFLDKKCITVKTTDNDARNNKR